MKWYFSNLIFAFNILLQRWRYPDTYRCLLYFITWTNQSYLATGCCCLVSNCIRLFRGPMDCSLPGSSVHWISQARILEWVAFPFFRGSSWPRDRTCISCNSRLILYHWATWEAYLITYNEIIPLLDKLHIKQASSLCNSSLYILSQDEVSKKKKKDLKSLPLHFTVFSYLYLSRKHFLVPSLWLFLFKDS